MSMGLLSMTLLGGACEGERDRKSWVHFFEYETMERDTKACSGCRFRSLVSE